MDRNRFHGAALAALLLTLASCGGSDDDLAGGGGSDEANVMARARQRAPQQAQPTQGTADAEGLNCNLTAPNGSNVVGVTIGMSADDAYRAIACSNRALRVSFSDRGGFGPQALADGRTMRKSILGERDGERIVVALLGLPGQERVVTIRRTLEFASGQEPAVASMIAELEQKYGALAHNPAEYGRWTGHSLRDANNRPLAPVGSLLGTRCALSVGMQAGEPDLQGDCGLSVSARIEFTPRNEQLASRLVVSMNDGAFGMRQFEAVHAAAQAAAQGQQSREVEAAEGRTPTL